nr:MAG TPA: hypothetical protein [Caudoviricetes sp.]
MTSVFGLLPILLILSNCAENVKLSNCVKHRITQLDKL